MTTDDHRSTTTLDPLIHGALHGHAFHQGSLEPQTVLAAAKRYRRRRTTMTSAGASLAVCAVVGAFAFATVPGTGQNGSTVGPAGSVVTSGGAAVASIRTLPAGWSQLSAKTWFRVSGDKYRVGENPRSPEWKGSEADITAAQVARGWTAVDTSNLGKDATTLMLLRDNARRVVFTVRGSDGTFVYEAQLYRLAARPGWLLAFVEYDVPGPLNEHGTTEFVVARTEAFDADGNRLFHCDAPPASMTKEQLMTYQGCGNG